MTTLRLLKPALLLCCTMALAATDTTTAVKLPVVFCPRVSQAPQLDGRLDATEWAGAGRLSDFVLLGAKAMPRFPTHVYVMHTEQALYLGAQMDDDNPSALTANVTKRDGKVTEDDCLEVFIDTEGSRQHYAHLAINPLGTKLDEYDHDVAENFEWNAVAAVTATGWSVEIELPFDKGVPPIVGEKWNLTVCRNAVRVAELSTWCRHERGFHEPQAFGEMAFSAPGLTAQVDDLGNRLQGDNLAMATVYNTSSQPAAAKVNVVVLGRDRRSHYFGTVKKDIPAHGREQVYVPYKVRRCGPATLMLSVTDAKGVSTWRTVGYPIDLPDVSDPLDDTMSVIALAWKSWAALPTSAAKDSLKGELEEIQKEWGYLDAQMSDCSGTPLVRLAAISVEVQHLKDRAEALKKRVEDAGQATATETGVG